MVALLPAAAGAQAPATTWGTVGKPVPAAAVIASSTKPVQSIPLDARLPPPDDGLHYLRIPAARPAPPRPIIDAAIIHAAHAEPVEPPACAVSVSASAPAVAAEGQPVAVTLTVRNPGPCAAGPVVVNLPLPAGATVTDAAPATEQKGVASWRLPHLLPGGEQILRVAVLPGGGEALTFCPEVTFAQSAGPVTRIVRPPLGLVVQGPGRATTGDKIPFRIRVTNNTPSTLRRVVVACTLPAALTHAQGPRVEAELPGELPPGHSRTETLDVTAAAAGPVRLDVTARADGGLAGQAGVDLAVGEATVALELTGPRRVTLGQDVDIAVAVSNPGAAAIGAVSVSVPLPDGLEFVSAGQGGAFDVAAGWVAWTLPALAGQGRHVLALRVRGAKGGDWAVAGNATCGGARPARHTVAVLVEQEPRLALHLTRMDEALKLGGETSFEARVYNPGPGAAEQALVTFTLPPHLLPVQGDGPSRWRIDGQRVAFDALTLPARADAVFKIRARGVAAGPGLFRAEVRAAGLASPLAREAACAVRP